METAPRKPKTPLVAHKSIADLTDRILNTENGEERDLEVDIDLSTDAIRNLEATIRYIIDNRRKIKARDKKIEELVKGDLRKYMES